MSDGPLPDTVRTIVHDLRSPLTSLEMLLELGETDAAGRLILDVGLTALVRTALTELMDAVERLDRLSRNRP